MLNMKACLTCGLDITGQGVSIKAFISSMASPMRMGDGSLVSMPKRTESNPFSFSK
mgnify:CR=1 FL=1